MIAATVKSSDGSKIRYWLRTSQPEQVLVLVHGWACNSKFWRFQKEDFASAHSTILIDLPGHGESTGGDRDWTMAEFARDVLTVLDNVGAEQWVIAGHSMGGAVALELARFEPERTKLVIGVDSFTYDGFYRRTPDSDIDDIVRPYREDFSSAMFEGMDALFLPDADQELKHWICESMANTSEGPALASLEGLLRWDVDEVLEAVSVPVRCISAGAFLDPESVARLEPRIEFMEMQDVGHFLCLENPGKFNEKLLEAVAPYLPVAGNDY